MISLILIIIASISNACMDTLKDHFSVSLFQNLNEEFWNPSVSWKKKTIMTYRFDAWHTFKSIAIILICFAMVFYTPITPYKLLDVTILGIAWNLTFEGFYSKVFRKKINLLN